MLLCSKQHNVFLGEARTHLIVSSFMYPFVWCVFVCIVGRWDKMYWQQPEVALLPPPFLPKGNKKENINTPQDQREVMQNESAMNKKL